MTGISLSTRRIGAVLTAFVLSMALAGVVRAADEHGTPHNTAATPAATPGHTTEAAPAHGTGTAAPAAHGEGAHESPKLIPDLGPTQVITSLTTLGVFLLLLVVLGKYAWGPIVTGLKAREDKIRKDIHDAEAARARADATLKEYNARLATAEQQVRDLLAKATADAEQIAAGVRTRAAQEAEEIKEKATRDIDLARKQAIAQVYEQAAAISTSVAEKILQRNLNADDQRDLVNRSLEQLQAVGSN